MSDFDNIVNFTLRRIKDDDGELWTLVSFLDSDGRVQFEHSAISIISEWLESKKK